MKWAQLTKLGEELPDLAKLTVKECRLRLERMKAPKSLVKAFDEA